ncbi:MAG: hypothetical protein ACPG14_02005 [Flavobacteriaceae bacterium]
MSKSLNFVVNIKLYRRSTDVNGNKVLIKRGKSSVEYYPGKGIETVNPAIIDDELIFYLYKTDIDQTNNFTLELIEFKPNTIEQ